MTSFRDNLRGIVAMAVSGGAFVINDTLVKSAGASLPLGEILFIRGSFACVVLTIYLFASGLWRQIPVLFSRLVGWRTLAEISSTLFYLTALMQVPIANAITIMQIVPLAVTAAAAVFLAERVGWRRWCAILVGFAGVLIVVRPGLSGFDANALLLLAAVAAVAVRDLTTRALPMAVPVLLLTYTATLANPVAGIALTLVEDWVVPSPLALVQCAGAGTMLTLAYFTIIIALRAGDMSVIAPFRYVMVPLAIAAGFLVWNEVPDALTLIGSAVIVATGIYTLYRERRLAATVAARPAP